jgi:hypothetical protein
MNDSLTVAEKVRRQLKAGRKQKTRSRPSLQDAVLRLCLEVDRGQTLMQRYGLGTNDIRLFLLCRASVPGMPPIQAFEPPAPGNLGEFYTNLETLAARLPVDFLGIMWEQRDRDPKAAAPFFRWITEFVDDKAASLELLAFKNELAASKPAWAN